MSTSVANPDSLWDLVEEMQCLLDTREGMDPQDPNFPAISAEIDAQIEAQIRKVSGIHAFRAHALAMAARCDLMQSSYLAARLSWERTVDRLEEYVKSTMEHAGKKELVGSDGLKIKLKANPPSVVITDEAIVPWDYRETVQPPPVEKIVKAKIAKALKAGIDVPGADLNISSCRVDWGDSKQTKKKGASLDAEILPEIE